MAKYNDPKTGKTVEAKNLKAAKKPAAPKRTTAKSKKKADDSE